MTQELKGDDKLIALINIAVSLLKPIQLNTRYLKEQEDIRIAIKSLEMALKQLNIE